MTYPSPATDYFQGLPFEVLRMVFFKVLGLPQKVTPPWYDSGLIQKLRLISKRCNGILENSPEAWTALQVGETPAWTRKCIERAGTLPFEVYCDEDPWGNHCLKNFRPFMKVALTVLDRWDTFYLDMMGTRSYISRILKNPAPALRRIHIQNVEWSCSAISELFGGQTFQLDSLVLSDSVLNFSSGLLTSSQLRRLEMSNMQYPEEAPSIRRLGTILSSLPALEYLHLDTIALHAPFLDDGQLISVPSLLLLEICLKPEELQRLLPILRLSPGCKLVCRTGFDQMGVVGLEELDVALSALQDYQSRLQMADNEQMTLTINPIHWDFCTILISNASQTYSVELPYFRSKALWEIHIFKAHARFFENQPVAVICYVGPYEMDAEEIENILLYLDHITTVILKGATENMRPILAAIYDSSEKNLEYLPEVDRIEVPYGDKLLSLLGDFDLEALEDYGWPDLHIVGCTNPPEGLTTLQHHFDWIKLRADFSVHWEQCLDSVFDS